MAAGRSHYVAEVHETGQEVQVAGWVQRRRDHGGLIFIDLRDRSGLIQVVSEPGDPAFGTMERLKPEFVVQVTGEVRSRPTGMVNPDIETGTIEIVPRTVEILAESQTPPFAPQDADKVDELMRLKYRYIDLRRPQLYGNFRLRNEVLMALRNFFYQHGFLDVETPSLARSTPEGARDFLVPSRLQPGEFYALPQSPQIFKQLLMVAGFDRYYQIAKVFRDEDLRADRQPEFTQIDVEMSFMDREAILGLMEEMMHVVFHDALGLDLPSFPRMSWREAMMSYGSDKPDLRCGPALLDLTEVSKDLAFEVLAQAEHVVGLKVENYAPSRKELDQWQAEVEEWGASGLIWVVSGPDQIRSSARKWLGEAGLESLLEAAGAKSGDALFLVAGKGYMPYQVVGKMRLEVARRLARIEEGWRFLWVTEFPLFERSEEDGSLTSAHHPFTMPHPDDLAILTEEPEKVRSEAYDMVLNGTELASGSLRIHRPDLQAQIFRILGLGPEEIQEKFGFLVDAFQYGAPPHGGIAFGLDRLLMLMAGAKSIRDVIAFPKTARGTDPLMNAPSPVDDKQLDEVGLRVKK